MMDTVAGIVAFRHARCNVVTVSIGKWVDSVRYYYGKQVARNVTMLSSLFQNMYLYVKFSQMKNMSIILLFSTFVKTTTLMVRFTNTFGVWQRNFLRSFVNFTFHVSRQYKARLETPHKFQRPRIRYWSGCARDLYPKASSTMDWAWRKNRDKRLPQRMTSECREEWCENHGPM